jgi:hypothetical protein
MVPSTPRIYSSFNFVIKIILICYCPFKYLNISVFNYRSVTIVLILVTEHNIFSLAAYFETNILTNF